MSYKVREGDFIETYEDSIFDAKGLIHPPNRIVAFLRYFLDTEGERKRNGKRYTKVYSLSRRYLLLQKKHPQFLLHDPIFDETLCEVPFDAVKKHHKPVEKLQKLRNSNSQDQLQNLALQLCGQLKKASHIPWSAIGISGSIMVGLHKQSSDIDIIVYGSQRCRKVYSCLGSLLNEGNSFFKPYTRNDLRVLFDFRSKDTFMRYEDFVRSESRKVMQGKFSGRDYFIRFVKDWSEISEKYGDVRYVNVGYARVKATVVDDSESIFTPCVYKVSDTRVLKGSRIRLVEEIASFRGRFCEQARLGETIIAQGKVEHVINKNQNREHYRLLLGNNLSDYMILA